MCCRSFIAERAIHLGQFEKIGLIEFFEKHKLLISITKILLFVKQVVMEFYANLATGMFDPSSEKYGKAIVRGVTFEFTPAIINAYLDSARVTASFTSDYDEIVKEITGGIRTAWRRDKLFPSSQLTSKYAILERLSLYN